MLLPDNNDLTPFAAAWCFPQTFALNLSAPFVAQFFKDQVNTVMPYVDYLFGNEDELDAYATANGWEVRSRVFRMMRQRTRSQG